LAEKGLRRQKSLHGYRGIIVVGTGYHIRSILEVNVSTTP
jgi:hypothetical protein